MAAKTKTKPDGDLTKTIFVMTLKKEGKHVAHFCSDAAGVPSAFKDCYMPHDNFNDLGKPDTITVTIVPGDTLNG